MKTLSVTIKSEPTNQEGCLKAKSMWINFHPSNTPQSLHKVSRLNHLML